MRLDELSADAFRPHLNATFVTDLGRLTLTNVTERPAHGGLEQFSLLFRGPVGEAAPAGIYEFTHPALGRLDVYITPIGLATDRATYEACFSRHL